MLDLGSAREREGCGNGPIHREKNYVKRLSKIPANPNKRITIPMIDATIAPYLCSNFSAITPGPLSNSVSVSRIDEIPPNQTPHNDPT